MRQDCDREVENTLFERDDLPVCVDSTASQLSGVCNSLTVERELLEQHRGRSVATHLSLGLSLASLVSGFIHSLAHFVSDEVVADCVRLMDIVASASYSLEMD